MKVKIFLYLYSCCITYLYKPGMSNIRPWARCGSWSSLSVPRALLKPPPVGLNWWSVLGCHSKKAICMIIGFHNILKMWSKIVCSSLLSFATDVFLRNTLLWHIRGWALLAMPLQPTQIIKNICCVIFAEKALLSCFRKPTLTSWSSFPHFHLTTLSPPPRHTQPPFDNTNLEDTLRHSTPFILDRLGKRKESNDWLIFCKEMMKKRKSKLKGQKQAREGLCR